jgi:hypothetical protein
MKLPAPAKRLVERDQLLRRRPLAGYIFFFEIELLA